MSKDFSSEEELYQPVKEFLVKCGYSVQAEVNSCDVCGTRENELVVVELKRGLTIDLLVQAAQRQKLSDIVYVAIPKPKKIIRTRKWQNILHLLRRLELGLLLVSKVRNSYHVEEVLVPQPFDRANSKRQSKKKRKALMNELSNRSSDINTGGSTRKKIMTAYKEQALYIAHIANEKKSIKATDLRDYGLDSDKCRSIMYINHYGWFSREGNGQYTLTDRGKEALEQYSEVIEKLKNE